MITDDGIMTTSLALYARDRGTRAAAGDLAAINCLIGSDDYGSAEIAMHALLSRGLMFPARTWRSWIADMHDDEELEWS